MILEDQVYSAHPASILLPCLVLPAGIADHLPAQEIIGFLRHIRAWGQ